MTYFMYDNVHEMLFRVQIEYDEQVEINMKSEYGFIGKMLTRKLKRCDRCRRLYQDDQRHTWFSFQKWEKREFSSIFKWLIYIFIAIEDF